MANTKNSSKGNRPNAAPEANNPVVTESWLRHKSVVDSVPMYESGFRGCVAIGCSADDSNESAWITGPNGILLIPDSAMRWYSMIDVQIGRWAPVPIRPATVFTRMRTSVRFGMPTVSAPGATESFHDVRLPQDAKTPLAIGHAGTQAVRMADAMNWAMTSTAVAFRREWVRRGTSQFYSATGIRPSSRPSLLFGDSTAPDGRVYHGVANPLSWMPKPYLAFPASAGEGLFDWATGVGVSPVRVYTDAFKVAFLQDLGDGMPVRSPVDGELDAVEVGLFQCGTPAAALHFSGKAGKAIVRVSGDFRLTASPGATFQAGDVVGTDAPELPPNWVRLSDYTQWEEAAPALVGRRNFNTYLALWFDRQVIRTSESYIHVPAAVASPAAVGSDDSRLMWDVRDSLRYFNQEVDGFVFPTVKTWAWEDLVFPIADVAFDLTPDVDSVVPHVRPGRRVRMPASAWAE